jgi:hypothetical protein
VRTVWDEMCYLFIEATGDKTNKETKIQKKIIRRFVRVVSVKYFKIFCRGV